MIVDFSQINPVSQAELASFSLIADTQFAEEMGSVSFNRKLTGIVQPGIHRGFNFEIAGPNVIRLCSTLPNTAAIERDGQLITVQGQHPIEVAIPFDVEVAVVIEAISQHGLLTSQVDKNSATIAAQVLVTPIEQVQAHHVVIVTANVPASSGGLNPDHLSVSLRKVGGVNNSPTFEQADERYQLKGDYVTQTQLLNAVSEVSSGGFIEGDALLPKSGTVIFTVPANCQLQTAPNGSVLDVLVESDIDISAASCRLIAPDGETIVIRKKDYGSVVLGSPGGQYKFYRKNNKWHQF